MSRVQLALNVADIDDAVTFYSRLFGTDPAKRGPRYANFTVAEPPFKLVLIENRDGRGAGVAGALNHVGVEVASADEVQAATQRLADQGLAPDFHEAKACCYALQDKVWVRDPDGTPWEIYAVLADAPDATPNNQTAAGAPTGWVPTASDSAESASCC